MKQLKLSIFPKDGDALVAAGLILRVQWSGIQHPEREVLTLTWYTCMCLPFEVLFRKIWYSERWVFIRDEGAQIQNWVYFEQIIVKSTQFGQMWMLFYGLLMSELLGEKLVSENQIFEVRQAHPRTILAKVTSPGSCTVPQDHTMLCKLARDFVILNDPYTSFHYQDIKCLPRDPLYTRELSRL